MIYALGLDSDRTFCHFLACARVLGVEVQAINLRELAARGNWHLVLPDDGSSSVTVDGTRIGLDPKSSYYWRPIDLGAVQATETAALRWRGLIFGLAAWFEIVPGKVINRLSARSDNGAKPLHEHELAKMGFSVPQSLTSSDPLRLGGFTKEGPTIVKALSGVRADARLVTADEFETMNPAAGPIHLQRYVAGVDLRIHVVGKALFAEKITAKVVDYRQAGSDTPICFEPVEIPCALANLLIEATEQSGLSFAGWDFKLDEAGKYWCLEENPMPGYDGYDRRARGAITAALLSFLQDTTDPLQAVS